MNNFWKTLQKPIIALAPMADVTDSAFRQIIAKYSKVEGGIPYITWTEFVSADGLVLAPEEGRKRLLKDLEFVEVERPIVAQFFTSKPENMKKAASLALELGFNGVDINMGCPDKSIEKQGAGAALIKNPKLAREIIKAAKEGVKNKIPVSVKTRIGYNKDELEIWLLQLLAEKPDAITLHARTRKELSLVPARWERVKRAVEIRDDLKSETFILGNGDVVDIPDGKIKYTESGCDGVMLGRAIFGNPFLFTGRIPSLEEKLKVLVEHTNLFEQKMTGFKSFSIMKKHFKAYVKDFDGAGEFRGRLMEANDAKEVMHTVNLFLGGKM